MPLSRHQIRNEYSLGDPQLYKLADRDDSEAVLEGFAMAGLVGLLRHLGDLAQFAAEVFHDLHEEVMATTARGHCLITRVQQLEAEFPVIEKTFLTQTSHTSFLYKSGVDWHPNLCIDQNMVARGDLPRFVMDSYEECRDPPRLFLLDKFDAAGPGACLKRYTDPSFVKTESILSNGRMADGHREKKTRRVKKQMPHWRKGDTPEFFPSSHAKLHQLFLEERLESDGTDPERHVKLKRRQFSGSFLDQENKTSYMEKLLDMNPAVQKSVATTDGYETGLEIVEIGKVSPLNEVTKTDKSLHSSPDSRELEMKPSMDDFGESNVNEPIDDEVVEDTYKIQNLLNGQDSMNIESNSQVSVDDGFASEIDSYVDAMANIESEVEADSECRKVSCNLNAKPPESLFSDSQSLGNSTTSEDDNNFVKGRENSSCSISGNSMAESTTDSEARAVDLSFELHHPSKGIPGNETEEQARASDGALEADDFPKSAEYSGELSNISSCLPGLNNTVLPEDMETSVGETSLPTPELAEEFSDFANTAIVVDQSSSRSAEYGQSVAHPPTSDAIYPETMNQVNVAPNVACFVSSTRENSEDRYSSPQCTDSSNIQEEFTALGALTGAQDEASEQCPGSSFSDHGDSVTVDENKQDSFLDVGSLQRDSVSQDITHGHRDRSEPAGTGSHLEDSGTQSMEIDVISEHECYSNFCDMSKEFSRDTSPSDAPSEAAISSHSALAAENGSTINHSMVKVKHIEVDGSKETDAEKDRPVSLTDSFYQNEEESVQKHTVNLATQKDGHATQDPLVNSNSNISHNWSGLLAEDIMNHTKSIDGIEETPLISENSTQDMESTSLVRSSLYPSDLLSGTSQAVLKIDQGQLDGSSFPALGMFPVEPPINLEPPPLPPLPPMQWRLGRFQTPPRAVERQILRHTPGSVSPVAQPTTSVETEIVAASTKTLGHQGYSDGNSAQQGVLVVPGAVACFDVSSQNGIIVTGGENIYSFSTSQISVTSRNGNQTAENPCQPSVNPLGSESRDDAHASGSCPTVEDELSGETGRESWQPEHVPQATEQEAVNSNGELPHLSTELKDWHPQPGFVAPEMGSTLLSTHERVPINTNGNANGTVQGKLQRPRNPLIDEVVAIDKSKLRKVEQVKPPVESKGDEGESLIEQLQLRKVGERNKQLVESKTEEIGLLLEQLQLRKVGERVKPGADPRQEDTESPRVQLRKLVGRSASMIGPKIEDSLLEQIRNKSFNLRPAAMARPLVQGPRTNLRVAAILQKASNIRQAMAGTGSDEEDDDADSWSDC